MSVCLFLYEVFPDVKCLGSPFYNSKLKRTELDKFIESDECREDFFKEVFSDNKQHETIELTNFTSKSSSQKALRRYYKKFLNKYKNNISYVNQQTYGIMRRFIVVYKKAYRQGWFLKRSFLNSPCSCYFGFTRKEMNNFIIENFDFSDERALECYNYFNSVYQEGYIFECSF